MNQLLQGKSLTVFGDGNQSRAFSYIEDVAPHIANSVNIPEAYNETFNIGGDIDYTVNELAKTVQKVMGITQDINYQPARKEVLHAYADHLKAKRIFNLNANNFVLLEDGVAKMAQWVDEVGSRESEYFGDIEVEENLPPIWRK
jgi:UDP-glucose 4-epimerase|tara:strand:+ start:30 stop:461 length:432 start_codon:yes stop_codon:yes gene_type:complete